MQAPDPPSLASFLVLGMVAGTLLFTPAVPVPAQSALEVFCEKAKMRGDAQALQECLDTIIATLRVQCHRGEGEACFKLEKGCLGGMQGACQFVEQRCQDGKTGRALCTFLQKKRAGANEADLALWRRRAERNQDFYEDQCEHGRQPACALIEKWRQEDEALLPSLKP